MANCLLPHRLPFNGPRSLASWRCSWVGRTSAPLPRTCVRATRSWAATAHPWSTPSWAWRTASSTRECTIACRCFSLCCGTAALRPDKPGLRWVHTFMPALSHSLALSSAPALRPSLQAQRRPLPRLRLLRVLRRRDQHDPGPARLRCLARSQERHLEVGCLC